MHGKCYVYSSTMPPHHLGPPRPPATLDSNMLFPLRHPLSTAGDARAHDALVDGGEGGEDAEGEAEDEGAVDEARRQPDLRGKTFPFVADLSAHSLHRGFCELAARQTCGHIMWENAPPVA